MFSKLYGTVLSPNIIQEKLKELNSKLFFYAAFIFGYLLTEFCYHVTNVAHSANRHGYGFIVLNNSQTQDGK